MTQNNEPHDVVKLLVKRMESHPEEFSSDKERFSDRWERYISDIEAFGNEADKAALNAKLRDIWMVKIHEQVLDELLNGEERRRKQEEEREYERNLIMQKARNTQMSAQQAIPLGGGGTGATLPVSTSPYQNASAQGIVRMSQRQTWLDDYLSTGSITAAQPEPKLSKSAIDQIKQALGIKK